MTAEYYKLMEKHPEWEEYLDHWMLEMGIPQDILGYYYIMAAVFYAAEDANLVVRSVTKELYPKVAKLCDSTPSRVERAIRHAIELGCRYVVSACGNAINPNSGKPSNAELIALMANKVRRVFRKR